MGQVEAGGDVFLEVDAVVLVARPGDEEDAWRTGDGSVQRVALDPEQPCGFQLAGLGRGS